MQMRNDHVGSACYLHSAFIVDNNATTITYYYYGAGDRGALLLFNSGDEFSIRNVLIALDQTGRGKGDLITGNNADHRCTGLISNRRPVFHGTTRTLTRVKCWVLAKLNSNSTRRFGLHQSRCWTASQSNPGTSDGGVSCRREWWVCLYSRIYVSASFGDRWANSYAHPQL